MLRGGVSKFAQKKILAPVVTLSSILSSPKSLWLLDIIFSPSYIEVYFPSHCEVGQYALLRILPIYILTASRVKNESLSLK